MKFEFLYAKDGDGVPFESSALRTLLDEDADDLIKQKRRFLKEGRSDLWSGERYTHEGTGLTCLILIYVHDSDKEEPKALVLLPLESYENFVKICELEGWGKPHEK